MSCAWERYAHHYVNIASNPATSWKSINHIYPQIKRIWEQTSDKELLLELIDELNDYHMQQNLWHDLRNWSQRLLPLSKKMERAALLTNIGIASEHLEDWTTTSKTHQQALAIYQELDHAHGIALSLNNLGSLYDLLGKRDEAIGYYERVVEIGFQLDDPHPLAHALNNLGVAYGHKGFHQKAIAYYFDAIAHYQELAPHSDADNRWLAGTLCNLGYAYGYLQQWSEAEQKLREAQTLMASLGDLTGLADILSGLGWVLLEQDAVEDALSYYGQALDLHKSVGDTMGLASALDSLGTVLAHSGAYSQAIQYHERAMNHGRELEYLDVQASALNNLANVYNKLNQPQKAIACYTQAIEILKQTDDVYSLYAAYDNLAIAYWQSGDIKQAIHTLERAVLFGREVNHPQWEESLALLESLKLQ